MSPMLFGALALTLAQDPAPQDPPATALSDVVVEGRRLEALARDFIDDVADPRRDRGLARWNSRICVGVMNIRLDVAQVIADRVSEVADEVGVPVGEPGCKPNAVIVFADDGGAFARDLVERRRRMFTVGSLKISGSNRDLEAFQASERPVRWWQVSIPVDSETGRRAVRIPGDRSAPQISVFAASRINSQIRDDMSRVIIIADGEGVSGLNTKQLADYLAMVTLAQIDLDGETAAYDTVMNLFENRETVQGLTEWDMAYLTGLYTAEQNRLNPGAQARNVSRQLVRERRRDAGGVAAD